MNLEHLVESKYSFMKSEECGKVFFICELIRVKIDSLEKKISRQKRYLERGSTKKNVLRLSEKFIELKDHEYQLDWFTTILKFCMNEITEKTLGYVIEYGKWCFPEEFGKEYPDEL